jgi:hypothetical protein
VLMMLKDICPDAPQFDSPSVRVKFAWGHVEALKKAGLFPLAARMSGAGRRKVSAEQLAARPSDFVYLARPSGATAKLLRSLAETTEPTILWSQWAGYLKKGGAIPAFCAERGIEPLLVHSGGHAHPEDLATLVRRMGPKVVVPIHTEAAGLFAALMPNVRLLEDGVTAEVGELVG